MFDRDDLRRYQRLLQRATSVVPLRDVNNGATGTDVIGLRHDVDDNPDSFATAQNLARWEVANGYRSTYFVLHTAGYWDGTPEFRQGLETIAECGHEIGIHVNALAEALRTGRDHHGILYQALDQLRGWGHDIVGAASHGDEVCYQADFINYEMFTNCGRPLVDPNRMLALKGRILKIDPRPLAAFGLEYETYHLPRGRYLSDSGGEWNLDLVDEILDFPTLTGQLHILQHPDWWAGAFPVEVAA